MSLTPAFLDANRPDVPDLVVPRGVLPFYLPRRPVRGRLVRLGPLADALLGRHDLPLPVATLLGEALALTAGLATALKFRGSFSLQVKGNGAVPMLLADCTEAGSLRGTARTVPERLAPLLATTPAPSAAALLGQGYLAFTVDQGGDTSPHQGIVALEGDSLAAIAEHYFATSEQLPTLVRLACAHTDAGWRAGALIIQRIGSGGGSEESELVEGGLSPAEQEDSWQEALLLAQTLRAAELLDDSLPPEQLLWRLFHAQDVSADRARALAYGCRCSRARLAGILEGFPATDLDDMVVDGAIEMTCEFCNLAFRFPRTELRGSAAPDSV